MTLRENATEMLGLIDAACTNCTNAVYKLATGIVARQKEMVDLLEAMMNIEDASRIWYFSFPQKYTDLFLNTFARVNNGVRKLLAGTTLSKEEFAAINVEQIGIKPVQLEPTRWVIHDSEQNINNFPLGNVDFNLYQIHERYTHYYRWPFPTRFYYDSQRSGVDYGPLYLYTPKGSVNIPDSYWHEDIKSYGPYKYGPTRTAEQLRYSDLLNHLSQTYGTAYFDSEGSDKVWAVWPSENPSLTGKIFGYGEINPGAIDPSAVPPGHPPASFRSGKFLNDLDAHALKADVVHRRGVTSPYPDLYVGATIQSIPVGTYIARFGTLNAITVNGMCILALKILNYVSDTFEYYYDTDPASETFGYRYLAIHDAEIVQLANGSNRLYDISKLQLTMPRTGMKRYDLTDLLEGDFGNDKLTTGLDNHLHRQNKLDFTMVQADAVLNNLYQESKLDMTTTEIMQNVTSYEALVQLANLFTVKYAIERILYGHIHRVQK